MKLNPDKSSIKAVTFDLWETLLLDKMGWSSRRKNARCRNIAQALLKLGIKISVKQIALAFNEMKTWLADFWNMDKDVTHLDQIGFLIKTASQDSITMKKEWGDQLSLAYVSALFEVPPYLNHDARKSLQWLKNQDKLLGIICNTGLTPGFGLRKFLTRKGVAKYFDLMLFSDELGVRKPSPKIFQMAARKFQIEPREIVHIGDNLKSDVWGARNAGFKAIYLSTEVGRDRIAESDPTSLVSISRKINGLGKGQIAPDKTIISLDMVMKAVEELESTSKRSIFT